MLFSELEQLIKNATDQAHGNQSAEVEKVASSSDDSIDSLISEIDQELENQNSLEKRASKVALAKLIAAIDIL